MSSLCLAAELADRLQLGEPAIFPTDTLPALPAARTMRRNCGRSSNALSTNP